MRKIVLSLALLLVFSSIAAAAPLLSEFPLGMTQEEAVAKGLVMRDQQGGIVNVMFGGKEWPMALVFENQKLIYLILRGEGDEFISAADEGLWQLGWLIIYAATDKNLVFDAIKLSASGMDEMEIGDEYEKFQETMQSMGFTNSVSIYISDRVWMTFRQLRGENPVEKYPDATVCNVNTNRNEITLTLSTFGYINRINNQNKTSTDVTGNSETQKGTPTPAP